MKEEHAANGSHEEIQYLLPWYVNGTITAAEHEAIDAHLSECSVCVAELELLRDLRSVVTNANERLASPSSTPINAVIARVKEFEGSRDRRTILVRFSDWWSSLPVLSRRAIAAQAVILVVLAGLSAVLIRRAQNLEATARAERQRADLNESLLAQEKQGTIDYQALSSRPVDGGGRGIRITVIFREDATEKEIRELLVSINGATLIAGPSSGRSYIVGIATSPDADSQKVMNDAIAQLRRSDVVQLAEPLP